MSHIMVAKLNDNKIVYRLKTKEGFEYYLAQKSHLKTLIKHSLPYRYRNQIISFRQQIDKPPKKLTFLTLDAAQLLFT